MLDDIHPEFNGLPRKQSRDELKRIISRMRIVLIRKHNIETNTKGEIIPVRTTKQLKQEIRNPDILQIVLSKIRQICALEEAQKDIHNILTKLLAYWPNEHFDLLQEFLKEFHLNRCDV